MPKPNESTEPELPDDKNEDVELRKKSKKTKARLRTQGPYRKARADW